MANSNNWKLNARLIKLVEKELESYKFYHQYKQMAGSIISGEKKPKFIEKLNV